MKASLLFALACIGTSLWAQTTERERPAEWDQLVPGGRFADRFLAMPDGKLSSDTWGADCVKPRFVDNGIEDRERSYWGGNILKGEDGKYHQFVCGWREDSPKGHHEWPRSIVYHAVSDNSIGPFTIRDTVGPGHNPEAFRTRSGQYVIYVIDHYYLADRLEGPWTRHEFTFDPRDRKIIEGLSNLTFAQREDGSYLMICRGGGVWISRNGLSTYNQISDGRIYPPVEGEFEDPVVWRDSVQYHAIVNDWLGRIAFYMRSKDGVRWVTDPGEAYMPGIAVHKDGTKEDWFKYERIKILQDAQGRAVQANFAVIDTLKNEDKPNDRHSSKNIGIPLNPGLLMTLLDPNPITPQTKEIRLLIQAEPGWNPQTEIDVASLRFGASTEVNFGRGSRAIRTEKSGKDLIVVFEGAGHGITADEFAPKLIGKKRNGEMIFGYTRLPWVQYVEPILSARKPAVETASGKKQARVTVENFGQVASTPTQAEVWGEAEGIPQRLGAVMLPELLPYDSIQLQIPLTTTRQVDEESLQLRFVPATNEHINKSTGMETKETGYSQPTYPVPTKRYCQMLDLKNDPALIEAYKERHAPGNFWKEIGEGIRAVGILNMEIYIRENHLFMIVETPLDFDWQEAFKKLATLPRQAEWERYMSNFQEADPNASSDEKWQLMEQMFSNVKALE